MTQPTGAVADAPAPTTAPAAAELAARIQIPRRLPVRYDGQPLRHLSNSSYTKFLLCPEDWRRHYLKGERTPPTGAMFLGSRVDDALTAYYRPPARARRPARARPGPRRLPRPLAPAARRRAGQARRRLGARPRPRPTPSRSAWTRSTLTFAELVPRLGRPVAVQRKLEFALAPGARVDRPVLPGPRDASATPTPASRRPGDRRLQGQEQPDLAGQGRPRPAGRPVPRRTLARGPARRATSRFAQIAKPGARRKQMSSALVTTTRTAGQQRATLARIAQAASQIHALYERYGPDEPWGFADPTGWKCCERYCPHWRTRARAAPASDRSERGPAPTDQRT